MQRSNSCLQLAANFLQSCGQRQEWHALARIDFTPAACRGIMMGVSLGFWGRS